MFDLERNVDQRSQINLLVFALLKGLTDGTFSISGGGGGGGDASAANQLTQIGLETAISAVLARPTTGTLTNVPDSAASVTILAANASRKGAAVYNDSTANLYLHVGAGAASTTSFTIIVFSNGYYEVPSGYTGIITGIWDSAPGGAARVTELT